MRIGKKGGVIKPTANFYGGAPVVPPVNSDPSLPPQVKALLNTPPATGAGPQPGMGPNFLSNVAQGNLTGIGQTMNEYASGRMQDLLPAQSGLTSAQVAQNGAGLLGFQNQLQTQQNLINAQKYGIAAPTAQVAQGGGSMPQPDTQSLQGGGSLPQPSSVTPRTTVADVNNGSYTPIGSTGVGTSTDSTGGGPAAFTGSIAGAGGNSAPVFAAGGNSQQTPAAMMNNGGMVGVGGGGGTMSGGGAGGGYIGGGGGQQLSANGAGPSGPTGAAPPASATGPTGNVGQVGPRGNPYPGPGHDAPPPDLHHNVQGVNYNDGTSGGTFNMANFQRTHGLPVHGMESPPGTNMRTRPGIGQTQPGMQTMNPSALQPGKSLGGPGGVAGTPGGAQKTVGGPHPSGTVNPNNRNDVANNPNLVNQNRNQGGGFANRNLAPGIPQNQQIPGYTPMANGSPQGIQQQGPRQMHPPGLQQPQNPVPPQVNALRNGMRPMPQRRNPNTGSPMIKAQ